MTELESFDLRSLDLTEEKKQELLRLFPEIRTEGGKIDIDRLKLVLGESVDVGKERYGLNWPGKADCFKTIQAPSLGTLLPCPEESVNFDTTENLIIEGDNLEVLKLLQKSYLGKVKMIYIDPPYNTGNDFIYPDNYAESLQTYLEYTGQVDSQGRKFSTNTDTDGRFHSKWLNMMYPRLYLARNLLREDGVIFVSIDDNEVHSLRMLMNEVFGEENFVAQVVVQLNPRGRHLDRFVAKTHEYVVVYARDTSQQPVYEIEKDERMKREYNKRDERGDYRELELRNRNPSFNRQTRPNLYYAIFVDPTTGRVALERDSRHTVEVFPKNSIGQDSCWTWSKAKLLKDRDLVLGRKASGGGWRIFRKDYSVGSDGQTPTTLPKGLWLDADINNETMGRRPSKRCLTTTRFLTFRNHPHWSSECSVSAHNRMI